MKTDKIEIYESRKVKGQFGWRYIAKNGKKVAIAGELYHNRSHAVKMAAKLFPNVRIVDNTAPAKRLTNPVK